MKKYLATALALSAIVCSSFGLVTNTVTFGAFGTAWTGNWTTNNGVSPTEYSLSRGVSYDYTFSELSNTTFTVTFTETNGIPVYAGGNWLYASTDGAVSDRRLDSNEVLRLKVSYSDPSGKLQALRVSGVRTTFNTNPYETMVFSDGVNSTNITDSDDAAILDYDAMGLGQLSTNNVGTWELLVGVDDAQGGGTNFTEAGMGSLILEYIADVEEIPPYEDAAPAVFNFVDGSEFDNVGPGVSMTRSNSFGSAITITTIEVIGQDGTSATNGTANKTNITSLNALAVNSAANGPYSNEFQDFNPNEAIVVTCNVDIVMVEISLASTSVDTEMTVSSTAFDDFVLLGNGNSGVFSLSNTFVTAGTPITIQMTSTTNVVDRTLRIRNLTLDDPASAASYEVWVRNAGLVSIVDAYGDDWDNDNFDNFAEFALGGDPLVKDAEVMTPTWHISGNGGTNYLNYIHNRRIQYLSAGLDYSVDVSTDLTVGPVGVAEEAGAGAVDAEIESLTNRVSTDLESQQFLQLRVSTD